MFLRSVVHYNPADQSKGKPPKFRGSDAMEVLITSGLVDTEGEAGVIIEELESECIISPSKGDTYMWRGEVLSCQGECMSVHIIFGRVIVS